MSGDLFDDDFEDETLVSTWMAADDNAVQVLLGALPGLFEEPPPFGELQRAVAALRAGVADEAWPYDYFAAAGWDSPPPLDDVGFFLQAVESTVVPFDDPPWPPEDLAAVAALEHADWAGAVIGLVRGGPGAPADPQSLIRYIDACPELEGDRDPEDDTLLVHAFEVLMPLWQALRLLDDERRVTRLGAWALPQALLCTWQPPRRR